MSPDTSVIASAPRRALIAAVRLYRLLLSPWLGSSCRFFPSCSAYAIEALESHGATRGSYLTARRLLRCQPWCAGGHDPVPMAGRRVNPSGTTAGFSASAAGTSITEEKSV